MKRVILPASALVLVVTACGAGANPAPRLSKVRGRPASAYGESFAPYLERITRTR